MNFIFVSVSCKNIVQLIEIKYFDKLSYQDIQYTVSRECNLRDPVFCTANGLPIKDNFLADYVQNFAQDSSFVLFVKERETNETVCGTSARNINTPNQTASFHTKNLPQLQPETVAQKPQQQQPSIGYTPQEDTPLNDFNSKEDLLNFLKSNPICCLILATYKNTKELSGSDRIKMSKSIVQHLLFNHPNRTLSRDHINKVITYIIELFPEEKRETYLRRNKLKSSGKIHDAYNNYRCILAKQGIIKRRSKNSNDKPNSENLSNDESTATTTIATTSTNNNCTIVNEPIADPLKVDNQNNLNEKYQSWFSSNIDSVESLNFHIERNPRLRIIKSKYDLEKDLSYTDKKQLSTEIIKIILTKDFAKTIPLQHLENISKFISQIFPNEKSEYYYYQFNTLSKNASGLLIDAYNHTKQMISELSCAEDKHQRNSSAQNLKQTDPSEFLNIKIEPTELTPIRYFNFDNINDNLNENSDLFVSPKRKHNDDLVEDNNEQHSGKRKLRNRTALSKTKTDSEFNKEERNTTNNVEFMKKFSESFTKMQKDLMTEFFNIQSQQNQNFLKSFEQQISKTVETIKEVFIVKSSLSASSVTTTTSTTE